MQTLFRTEFGHAGLLLLGIWSGALKIDFRVLSDVTHRSSVKSESKTQISESYRLSTKCYLMDVFYFMQVVNCFPQLDLEALPRLGVRITRRVCLQLVVWFS